MCCGKYKEELFRQDTINAALVKVHHQVKAKIDWGNAEKKKGNKTINVKDECESTLYNALKETEFIVKLRQTLILGNDSDLVTNREKIGNDAAGVNLADSQQIAQSELAPYGAGSDNSFKGYNKQGTNRKNRGLSRARTTDKIKQYFGMHYIGAVFDINNIEKRLQEAKVEY